MANQEKQCWAQHITGDAAASERSYIGRCPYRKGEIDESGKRSILKIFSLGLIGRKFSCTLPEGEKEPTSCRQGRDYLAH